MYCFLLVLKRVTLRGCLETLSVWVGLVHGLCQMMEVEEWQPFS